MENSRIQTTCLGENSSIKEAMMRLNETGTRILFVVDKSSHLTGTVTDGDIRRGIINGSSLGDTLSGIMNRDYLFVSADSKERDSLARDLMQKHLVNHIPALDRQGNIKDVISWTDSIEKGTKALPVTHEAYANPVVIMAGGRGTRLDPFTKILPKPLVPLNDKPVIEHIMDKFYLNGFSRFILILNYKKEMIRTYFSNTSLPYKIEFVDEEKYCGTAGGLSLLRSHLQTSFIVTNCDTILEGNYSDFFKWHREHGNMLTIIGSHKEIEVPYGVLSMNNGRLIDIDEKPRIDLFINTGTYIFEPSMMDYIPDREYLDMDKLIERVKSEQNDHIEVYPHWGGWLDLGQWDEYRKSLKKIGECTDGL